MDFDLARIDLNDNGINADVCDFDAMVAALKNCDTVIHLAGVVEVEADWKDVYATNIGGTYNVF